MKGLRKAFVAIFVFGVVGSGYYYWLKKKKNT